MHFNILFRFFDLSHGLISLDGVAAVTVPIGESYELKKYWRRIPWYHGKGSKVEPALHLLI